MQVGTDAGHGARSLSHGSDVAGRTGAGRYAPSPTGDLHLGNLRTALLAWLFARSSGRAFRLRIEDLDTGRVRPGTAARQLGDLAALGLTFDGEPVRQSTRGPAYGNALDQLCGLTYECYCTRREIAEAASAPHGEQPRYPGTCRDLTSCERAERRQLRPAALRVRADGARETVTDLLHGEVTGIVDDFVVRRGDGVVAYNLAVVVDDSDAGVDQVVRGDDLLPAAVNQSWLTRRLGRTPPVYAHVPLALNPAGARLAKRDGAVTLADQVQLGRSPADVLGRLAVSLELAGPDERVTPTLLLARFDPARLPREPWIVSAGY